MLESFHVVVGVNYAARDEFQQFAGRQEVGHGADAEVETPGQPFRTQRGFSAVNGGGEPLGGGRHFTLEQLHQ